MLIDIFFFSKVQHLEDGLTNYRFSIYYSGMWPADITVTKLPDAKTLKLVGCYSFWGKKSP